MINYSTVHPDHVIQSEIESAMRSLTEEERVKLKREQSAAFVCAILTTEEGWAREKQIIEALLIPIEYVRSKTSECR